VSVSLDTVVATLEYPLLHLSAAYPDVLVEVVRCQISKFEFMIGLRYTFEGYVGAVSSVFIVVRSLCIVVKSVCVEPVFVAMVDSDVLPVPMLELTVVRSECVEPVFVAMVDSDVLPVPIDAFTIPKSAVPVLLLPKSAVTAFMIP